MAAELRWNTSFANTNVDWKWVDSTDGTATYDKLRFKKANDNTDDPNDPLQHPGTAGTNYSAEKFCGVLVKVNPSVNLSNLRIISNKANGIVAAGITLYYGFEATYVTPDLGTSVSTKATATLGSTGTNTWVHSGTDTTYTNTGTNTTTTDILWGDMVVFQLRLGTTCSGGEIAAWTITALYDEI